MLELGLKFKTMINLLSTLMEKVDNIQKRWVMQAGDGNSKKE